VILGGQAEAKNFRLSIARHDPPSPTPCTTDLIFTMRCITVSETQWVTG